jgi:hypothetical protein
VKRAKASGPTGTRGSRDLFRLLESAGIPAGYARSLLPEWWDGVEHDSPAVVAELKLHLARNLGVDFLDLSGTTPKVTFRLPHVRKLKRSVRYTDSSVSPAAAICVAAARIAAQGCARPFTRMPSADHIRDFVLSELGGNYVSLRGIIQTCWAHGIPVVHVGSLPDGMPRMDGLIVRLEERPVIVTTRNIHFSAWMSFILAHEMGHSASGHLGEDQLLMDEALLDSPSTPPRDDSQESEADSFAFSLLGGTSTDDDPLADLRTPEDLARSAMAVQRERSVDAGHILLRHAYRSGFWKQAMAALGALDRERRALSDLREALFRELIQERLPSSSLEFLSAVTTTRS